MISDGIRDDKVLEKKEKQYLINLWKFYFFRGAGSQKRIIRDPKTNDK